MKKAFLGKKGLLSVCNHQLCTMIAFIHFYPGLPGCKKGLFVPRQKEIFSLKLNEIVVTILAHLSLASALRDIMHLFLAFVCIFQFSNLIINYDFSTWSRAQRNMTRTNCWLCLKSISTNVQRYVPEGGGRRKFMIGTCWSRQTWKCSPPLWN